MSCPIPFEVRYSLSNVFDFSSLSYLFIWSVICDSCDFLPQTLNSTCSKCSSLFECGFYLYVDLSYILFLRSLFSTQSSWNFLKFRKFSFVAKMKISSAKLWWCNLTPHIFIPLSSYAVCLNTFVKLKVNNFGKIISPCDIPQLTYIFITSSVYLESIRTFLMERTMAHFFAASKAFPKSNHLGYYIHLFSDLKFLQYQDVPQYYSENLFYELVLFKLILQSIRQYSEEKIIYLREKTYWAVVFQVRYITFLIY